MALAASFWANHRDLITAIATVVVAFVLAQAVDRSPMAERPRVSRSMTKVVPSAVPVLINVKVVLKVTIFCGVLK